MASTSNGVNEGSSMDATMPNNSVQPSMTMHSVSYPPMPMHTVYAVNGLAPQQPLRSKRRQVKNACTNCQKACKKCDDARPCLRCVKYAVQEECVDSQRKERKKGVKRGPYKKRDGRDRTGSSAEEPDLPEQQQQPPGPVVVTAIPPMPNSPPPMAPMYYPPPGFYPQYAPPPAPPKPGEPPAGYYAAPFYIPVPAHGPPPPGQEGDVPAYPQHYYQPAFLPYPQPYPPPYMMHPRPDGQMSMPSPYAYGPPMYPAKPPSAGPSTDMNHPSGSGSRDGEDRDGGADKST